jgi:TetR/AcrR family transcriptional regulator, transcriptional repressor for nem operon
VPRSGGPTRDHLIATTRELLWDRGYAATSPRAVQERAGVGQGSLYHHFRGKQELAAAALTATAEDLLATAERDLAGDGTSPAAAGERLRAYLLRSRDVLRGCPVGRMAADPDVLDAPALREVVGSTFERLRGRIVDLLRVAAAGGGLRGRPEDVADTLLAVVQGGYVLARAAGDPAPFDRAVRGAVALLDAALPERAP